MNISCVKALLLAKKYLQTLQSTKACAHASIKHREKQINRSNMELCSKHKKGVILHYLYDVWSIVYVCICLRNRKRVDKWKEHKRPRGATFLLASLLCRHYDLNWFGKPSRGFLLDSTCDQLHVARQAANNQLVFQLKQKRTHGWTILVYTAVDSRQSCWFSLNSSC